MESFFRDMFSGLRLVFSSFRTIRDANLSYVYLYVAVVAIAFWCIGFAISSFFASHMTEIFNSVVSTASFFDSLPDWLVSFSSHVVGFVSWLGFVILFAIISGCITLVFLSPLLTFITDKVWPICTSRRLSSLQAPALIPSLLRSISVAFCNTVMQFFIIVLIFILSFVPVVGLFTPILALAVNAFFQGASFADYALEHASLSAHQSRVFAQAHRGFMIGVGLPFFLALFIPVVGLYVALALAPATTVAGVRVLAKSEE